MRTLDEIAHRNDPLTDTVTDFYLVHGSDGGGVTRYKVTETGHPTRIVGGKVEVYRYDYVVFVLRTTGWVEVLRVEEEHADDATHAALIAHRILTEEE